MTKVSFIRVVPDEITRYGPAAAVVLAHIRYRCASAGPGRIERDGRLWWRVTYSDLGREVGMSVKVVRRALEVLAGTVAAKHFPPLSDQSRAFSVCSLEEPSDQPEAPQGSCEYLSDRPSASEGISSAPEGSSKSPTGQPPLPHRASALPIENLEEGEEARSPRAHPTPQPDQPSTANSERPKRPRCELHAHLPDDDRGPDCLDCRDKRLDDEARTRKAQAEADARKDRIRRAIRACPHCDDFGRLDDDLSDCPHHPNFRQQQRTAS